MNFFKNLFSPKQDSKKDENQSKERIIEIRTVTKFEGLDDEFINLLFFISEDEKVNFRKLLLDIIRKLNITTDTLRTEFMEHFPKYISENEIELPFIAELFIFNSEIQTVSLPDNTIFEKREGYNEMKGKKQLEHYYTALRLASHNLTEKDKNKIENISAEENLVLESLSDSHKDFARINIIYQLGRSYMQRSNFEKMMHYYESILSETFDLSPNTVADYVRVAGENLHSINYSKEALGFLKKGLVLNPKLGVKKLVAEIEKKIN